MKIGVIGSGLIGGGLTRRLSELGHDVTVANSRGPESLADLAAESGATAGTVEQAADGADLVVLAVPLLAVPDLPLAALDGHLVVDANNYYPQRDGQIAAIDDGATSARWTADQIPNARVVKVFNNIQAAKLEADGLPAGEPGRIALPVAGDDAEAKRVVSDLVEALGFDAVDAGGLDDSWRQEVGTPAYGLNEDAESLRTALAAATRS